MTFWKVTFFRTCRIVCCNRLSLLFQLYVATYFCKLWVCSSKNQQVWEEDSMGAAQVSEFLMTAVTWLSTAASSSPWMSVQRLHAVIILPQDISVQNLFS